MAVRVFWPSTNETDAEKKPPPADAAMPFTVTLTQLATVPATVAGDALSTALSAGNVISTFGNPGATGS